MALTPHEQTVVQELDAAHAAALQRLRFARPGSPEYNEAARKAKELGDQVHALKDLLIFGRRDAAVAQADLDRLTAARQQIERATKIEDTLRAVAQTTLIVLDLVVRLKSAVL